MKNLIFTIVFIVTGFISFAQMKNNELLEIKKVMNAQSEAWNNADIGAFMEGYWKSDSLKFIGKNGIKYGWQTTLDNYKKSYPDAAAMGKLTFTILELELQSATSAFMIGKWDLKRKENNVGGHFTLLWKKINNKWLIVADHTS